MEDPLEIRAGDNLARRLMRIMSSIEGSSQVFVVHIERELSGSVSESLKSIMDDALEALRRGKVVLFLGLVPEDDYARAISIWRELKKDRVGYIRLPASDERITRTIQSLLNDPR
jgi:hypothetical protein